MLELKKKLEINDFVKVIFNNEELAIDRSILDRVIKIHKFLEEFSENKVIYGVNTGFGPMAQYKIDDKDRIELQFNLIRSHASGVGKPIEPDYVKALMLARLNTLSLGKSGVNISVINGLRDLINNNITPLIFEHGGVGASGDLVQLAHLALVLIGEGEVFYKGERRNTADVYDELGLKPIEIKIREGLALMNGTSAMTGIGIVNVINAQKLLDWSICCSAAINEIVEAYDDHLSEELNNSKLHLGQQEVAKKMRDHLSDSKLTRDRTQHLYSGQTEDTYFKEKVQEYYSLRCVPQILGPVCDTIKHVGRILIEELNSANDNPIIDVETEQVYHGGNFHGDYVSLEMDKLKLVITKLSMLAERQLNYLLNSKLNDILPPFANLGKLGFNFGMQGIQFTAVSTTAENQTLSNPMYVHSIPNNNDNQDIVSMGTNAANMTKTVIENTFEVLAIELMTIVQGLEYLNFEERLSTRTQNLVRDIKKIVPPFTKDYIAYPYVQEVKDFLKNNDAY
ncbi:histidine ammonia-lyase [Flavobacteriaceae bacterium (ex Bugula neritina AB1)]|nr:histidine ammonia-lyase [Flavobacteriaceae bacterium (ex Bugula neritina AB1)]